MELDDLKQQWKTATVEPSAGMKDVLARKVSEMRSSGRGLRTVFYIEMAFVVVIYTGFLWIVLAMGSAVMSYMYKLVIATGIATAPIAWRMYKSQRWINSMDYTQDMRSNMIAFLDYYKTTLRWYQWSSYAIILVIIILFFTDNDFIRLQSGIKFTIVIYLAVIFLLTEPYIRIVYRRRLTVFEDFLKE
jgi:hypothetical protein